MVFDLPLLVFAGGSLEMATSRKDNWTLGNPATVQSENNSLGANGIGYPV